MLAHACGIMLALSSCWFWTFALLFPRTLILNTASGPSIEELPRVYVYRYSIWSIRRFNPQLLLPVSRELMVVVSRLEAVRFWSSLPLRLLSSSRIQSVMPAIAFTGLPAHSCVLPRINVESLFLIAGRRGCLPPAQACKALRHSLSWMNGAQSLACVFIERDWLRFAREAFDCCRLSSDEELVEQRIFPGTLPLA